MRGIAMQQRRRLEPAVEVIGPAVIAAAELRRVPAIRRHHHGAAMGALVVQQLQLSVGVAYQQQRLAADPRGEEAAGILHLALVPDIEPARAEAALALELED